MSALIDVLAPLALIALGVAYLRRASNLARRERPVPVWRQLCFAAGLLLLVLADVPPLATIAEELVVAHMAQHLVIGDLAALLIVLGLTGPLLQPVLAVRGLGWLRALGHPAVALPLWVLNLYLWHLAALYQGVLDSPALHLLQHAGFLGFGVAMWMPLAGPLPKPAWFGIPAQLGYVVLVRLSGAVLANILAWSGSPLYPDYAPGEAEWSISPLADQGAAGMVMMVESGFVTLGLFAWLFFRWARQDTERQRLLDLARERGVPLDERRAARAAAAGQAGRLEERIRGT
jgi:cytochrome c oxidase assembly factor CtaG